MRGRQSGLRSQEVRESGRGVGGRESGDGQKSMSGPLVRHHELATQPSPNS